jgi:hypothetical protein
MDYIYFQESRMFEEEHNEYNPLEIPSILSKIDQNYKKDYEELLEEIKEPTYESFLVKDVLAFLSSPYEIPAFDWERRCKELYLF